MVTVNIGKVKFELKEFEDFSWLNTIGKVVFAADKNEEGIMSFGLEAGNKKYFVEYADGEKQKNTAESAADHLKKAIMNLDKEDNREWMKYIRKIETNDGIAAVFEWIDLKRDWDDEKICG